MTSGDVVQALRDQNVQVSGGSIGGPPTAGTNAFQYTVTTEGRFSDARQFRYVIVKATESGRLVQLQDVARIELGAKDYVTNSYLNGKPAVALGIFSRPGTNALDAADAIKATMENLAKDFPPGLEYDIVYNPTEFISELINEVYKTILEAAILVAIVVLVFLQSWRTAIIPIVAIPVSLIGTFAFLLAFGFSLNMLTLFGLVLAIGIVVDDAIVVVENVERNLARGMTPKQAAHVTMDEVGTAVIAISLVLIAVFVPTAFIPGISGQFYLQFAVTISVATAISALNSLTLSPALAAIILRPHRGTPRNAQSVHALRPRPCQRFQQRLRQDGSRLFLDRPAPRWIDDRRSLASASRLRRTARGPPGTWRRSCRAASCRPWTRAMPSSSSSCRTAPRSPVPTPWSRGASEIIRKVPGVRNAVAFAGFNGATFTNASNSGVVFAPFAAFEERLKHGQSANQIIGQLYGRLQSIQEAFIIAVPPPSIRGIGNSGGFKMQIVDRESSDMRRVLGLAYQMMGAANQTRGADRRLHDLLGLKPAILPGDRPRQGAGVERADPQYLRDAVDQPRHVLCQRLQCLRPRLSGAGAGRPAIPRWSARTFSTLKVRSATGALVPLGTLVDIQGYDRPVTRAALQHVRVGAAPGQSCPRRLDGHRARQDGGAGRQILPPGTTFEWTELAFQERNTGNTAIFIFALSVVFVFLALSAQYESWVLPLAIILIVPLAVLAALIGVHLRGMDNNILTQIGLDRADRPCGEERDPDRRVRPAARRTTE